MVTGHPHLQGASTPTLFQYFLCIFVPGFACQTYWLRVSSSIGCAAGKSEQWLFLARTQRYVPSFVLVFSLAFLSCLFEFHAILRWTPVVTRLPSCFTPRCSSGSSPASTPASSQRAPAARSTFWIYLASKTSPTTHLSRFFAAPACCSFAQRYDVMSAAVVH